MFVLSLPEDILYDVLSEWVSLLQLAFLDVALCNRVFRVNYLKMVDQLPVQCTIDHMPKRIAEYWKWIATRNFKIVILHLASPDEFVSGWSFAAPVDLKSVKSLFLENCSANAGFLLNECSSITSLSIKDGSIMFYVSMYPQLLNCLENIAFKNNYNAESIAGALQIARQHCKKLKSFTYHGNQNEELLNEIIKSNAATLKYVWMRGNLQTLAIIASDCHLMEEIFIFCFTVEAFMAIMSKCPNIKKLRLGNDTTGSHEYHPKEGYFEFTVRVGLQLEFMSNFTKLKTISLKGKSKEFPVQFISQSFETLVSLSFTYGLSLQGADFIMILNKCTCLKSLTAKLEDSNGVKDEDILTVFSKPMYLTKLLLELHSMKMETIHQVLINCPILYNSRFIFRPPRGFEFDGSVEKWQTFVLSHQATRNYRVFVELMALDYEMDLEIHFDGLEFRM